MDIAHGLGFGHIDQVVPAVHRITHRFVSFSLSAAFPRGNPHECLATGLGEIDAMRHRMITADSCGDQPTPSGRFKAKLPLLPAALRWINGAKARLSQPRQSSHISRTALWVCV